MIRTVKYMLLALAAALALAGCKRTRVIPDDELAMIFRDIFVANAYGEQRGFENDSLSPYQPILDKYGYTVRDVQYTIGNFSKRKSARISDVVDAATELLNAEYDYYSNRVSVKKHIEEMAREMFSRPVIADSTIAAERIADTARLRISVPVEPGEYKVAFRYFVDSTDMNERIRFSTGLIDTTGRRQAISTIAMTRKRTESYERSLHIDSVHKALFLRLGIYGMDRAGDKIQKPSMRIDSLYVTYYLPTDIALDSLDERHLRYRLSIWGNPMTRRQAEDSPLFRQK